MVDVFGTMAYMKKNNDGQLTEQDFELMDLLFKAGWEFGKANLTKDAGASLTLFKAAIREGMDSDAMAAVDKLIKAGMKVTDRLYAAEGKKNAEMN